jgi:hypothetical protein
MFILSKILTMKGVPPQRIKVTITFIIFIFGYIFHPTAAESFGLSFGNIIPGTDIVFFRNLLFIIFSCDWNLVLSMIHLFCLQLSSRFQVKFSCNSFLFSQKELFSGTCYHTVELDLVYVF